MKEDYMGYRPGDRIQMMNCKDRYAPILPGERGTIDHIDDMGTLHMRWDSGRTLGVCLEEDEVRKIPVEQEWELLHAASVMHCDETQFDAHCEETNKLINAIDAYAEETGGEWVTKSIYLDPVNKSKAPVFEFLGAMSVDSLMQSCDVKQGADIAFTAKRPQREQSLLLIAYGQNYSMSNGVSAVVTEVLECKLVTPAAAKDFHERIDAGWPTQGKAAAHLFSSAPDHESLAACIRDCKAIIRTEGKKHEQER